MESNMVQNTNTITDNNIQTNMNNPVEMLDNEKINYHNGYSEQKVFNPSILSNLLATFLTSYFKIPIMYYGGIIEMIKMIYIFINNLYEKIFMNNDNNNINNYSKSNSTYSILNTLQNINLVYIISFVLWCFILYNIGKLFYNVILHYIYNSFYYNKKIIEYKNYNYSKKEIDDIENITIISNYLKDNNLYVDKNISHINILNGKYDPRVKVLDEYKKILNLHIPSIHKPIYFEDNKENVFGYIIWNLADNSENITEQEINFNNNEKSKSDTNNLTNNNIITKSIQIKTQIPYLVIYLNNGDANSYINKILDIYNNHPETIVKTNYFSSTQFCIPINIVKNKDIQSIYEKNKKLYIDTFFHMKKQEMWSIISKIHFEPEYFIQKGQYPQLSLCLYGPPGTGKSSFAFRLGKALCRNVVMIDLIDIPNKIQLKSIFMDHYINYNGELLKSNETIFVLDEFDISIQYLYAKDQLREKNKNNLMENTFELINKMKEYTNKKYSKNTKDSDNNDSYDKKEIENLFNEHEAFADDTDITLNDLLSILQGPCSNNGSIIIATTNKFHTIKDICPRLFRDGRLKPYYFGYPCRRLLNEITKYYFDREILDENNNTIDEFKDEFFMEDDIHNTIPISQSKILHHIVNLLLLYDDNKTIAFEKFIEFLKKEIDIYNGYGDKYGEKYQRLSFDEFDK